MLPGGRLVIFIMGLTWMSVAMVTAGGTAANTTWACIKDQDAEMEDPTFIYIECGTVVMERDDYAYLDVFRTNSRGLVRIKYAVTSVHKQRRPAISERRGMIFFREGKNKTSIHVYLTNDQVTEGDETYRVEITETSLGTISRSAGIITVMDDDM